MIAEINLDEALAQMHGLMDKYSGLGQEIAAHHNIEEAGHHLHELQLSLGHLKAIVEEGDVEDEERKKHFLNHHAESVRHVLSHMSHVRQHLELHRLEAAAHYKLLHELHNTYRELHELYERMRERKEMVEYYKHHAHVTPYAGPFPLGAQHED